MATPFRSMAASASAAGSRRIACNMSQAGWTEKLELCFQLMETGERKLLDKWIANWSDKVDFDVYPVLPSQIAAEQVFSRLK